MQIMSPWINQVNIVPSEKQIETKKQTKTQNTKPKPPLAGVVFQFYYEPPRQPEQERSAQLQAPLASAATFLCCLIFVFKHFLQ